MGAPWNRIANDWAVREKRLKATLLMPALDAAAHSLISKIGAHESWAKTSDRAARTAPARAAGDQKFLDQADGDPVRAGHLRKAYFARLALKSAQARRKVRELTEVADQADQEMADTHGGAQ